MICNTYCLNQVSYFWFIYFKRKIKCVVYLGIFVYSSLQTSDENMYLLKLIEGVMQLTWELTTQFNSKSHAWMFLLHVA